MADEIKYKKLKYDGYDTVTELAICDGKGQNIIDTYCKKPFFTKAQLSGNWESYSGGSANLFRAKVTLDQLLDVTKYKIDILSDLSMFSLFMSLGALFVYLCTEESGVWLYGLFVDDKPLKIERKFTVMCTEVSV